MAEHKKTVLTDLGPFIVYFVRVYSCTCHRRVYIREGHVQDLVLFSPRHPRAPGTTLRLSGLMAGSFTCRAFLLAAEL